MDGIVFSKSSDDDDDDDDTSGPRLRCYLLGRMGGRGERVFRCAGQLERMPVSALPFFTPAATAREGETEGGRE